MNNWKEPPVDTKERNTWRGRREILGGEGEKYLEAKERNTWRARR